MTTQIKKRIFKFVDGFKVTMILSGEPEMGGFCLVVELTLEGCATNRATPYSSY